MKKLLFVLLIVACGPTRAGIDSDVTLDFLETVVSGSCVFWISDNEPYSAINSDCNLLKAGQVVNNAPISGYSLGDYPRDNDPIGSYYTWPTIDLNPSGGQQYCEELGYLEPHHNAGWIILGHNSNPELNSQWPGASSCDNAPTPEDCDDEQAALFSVDFTNCNGPTANFQSTADLFNFTVTNSTFESKIGSGSWTEYYEGPNSTCPAVSSIAGFWVRVFLETAYGTSSCQKHVYPPPCEPGGW